MPATFGGRRSSLRLFRLSFLAHSCNPFILLYLSSSLRLTSTNLVLGWSFLGLGRFPSLGAWKPGFTTRQPWPLSCLMLHFVPRGEHVLQPQDWSAGRMGSDEQVYCYQGSLMRLMVRVYCTADILKLP